MKKIYTMAIVITILVVTLFNVNNYSFTSETPELMSEKVFEDDKLESDKDDKLFPNHLATNSIETLSNRVVFSELSHYSYSERVVLLRPPIFL